MGRSRWIGLGLVGAIALGVGGGAIAVEPRVVQGELDVELAQANRDDQKREADRIFKQGIQQFQTSQFREALQSWETALELYRELGDRQGEATSLGNLGLAYRSLGEYKQAIDLHNQSLEIDRKLGDRQGEGASLGNLGNAYYSLGEYERAIDLHNQYLTIARELGDHQGEATSLGNLGLAYHSLGEYERAIDFHNQSLKIKRELGDRRGEGASLGNLGLAYHSLGEYERAIDFHNQSLTIARKIGDRNAEGRILGNLGNAYDSLGEYERAIDLHNQSLKIKREIGDRQGEAYSLGSLGLAYRSLGEYGRAIDFHNQYLTIAREIGDRQGEAYSLGNLGLAYRSLGEYKQAIDFHNQSLTIARELGDRNAEGRILGNLGNAYDALGEYERAIDLYNQSLKVKREIGDRPGEAYSLGNLGLAYLSLGEYEQAIVKYREALGLAREIKDRYAERIVLGNLGRAFREVGQTDTALTFFKQAINVTETIRRDNRGLDPSLQKSYANVIADDYRELADLLLTQGRVLEAQQVLDLLAIEEISDYNQNTRATVLPSGKIDYTDAEAKIRDRHDSLAKVGLEISRCELPKSGCEAQLPSLREQRRKLVIQFNQLTEAINKQSIARQSQEDGVQLIAGLNNSARKLVEQKENTLFVYTFINIDPNNPRKGNLWLIWMGPGGVVNTIKREVNPKLLADTALQFRRMISQNKAYDATEFQTLSQQLYQWIIDPLQEELDKNNIQHLIFRLDRELRYIPMAALHNGDNFLIERYTVANVINARDTDARDRLTPNRDTIPILALGLSKDHGAGALPHVPDELDAIVQERDRPDPNGGLYPGTSFLDEAFTFDALQNNLSTHQILHIATHGNFNPVNARETFLQLGNGDPLNLHDISTLSDLGRIHLAVLSACETGLSGNPTNLKQAAVNRPDGREINSLLYAFTANDQAKAVLSTLWKVDDGYTRIFMEEFYKNLNNYPQLTKAEVLRKTQLTFIHNQASKLTGSNVDSDGTHPYHWAPFTLTGNSW